MKNNLEYLHLIQLNECKSTNQYIKENFETLEDLSCIITDFQTNGYGKNHSVWESNKSENIILSILFKNKVNELNQMTIKVIKDFLLYLGIDIDIKFPNDFTFKGKKLSGFLIESLYLGNDHKYTVLGVGINVNQIEFTIGDFSSIKMILNKDIQLDLVRYELIQKFDVAINEMNYEIKS